MMPHVSACAHAALVDLERQLLHARDQRRWPTISPASSSLMLSSWPLSALVAGVKIGSGSRSDSRRPAGSAMPQTVPVCW